MALSLAACGGVREQIRLAPPDARAAFDARELVDVLPPGRIAPITEPRFESTGSAGEWLKDAEPVVAVTVGTESRAYPLAILVWHEVVEDLLGGVPVAVTYAPLANAAITFDRRVGDRTESFAASGKLYRSDLVMVDRSKTLWTQLDGKAVAGPSKGATLTKVPSQIVSLKAFGEAYPNGAVLARPTASGRGYGFNPYAGYEDRTQPFGGFIAVQPVPGEKPMTRIVAFLDGARPLAYPFERLRAKPLAVAGTGGKDFVVFWRPGARSALDTARIADGREVGQTGVFSAWARGETLDFEPTADGFRDHRTGSTWNVFGVATAGPLKGSRLQAIPHVDTFWFAWTAFYPETAP
jgi:uncharacterized protein DUF3179